MTILLILVLLFAAYEAYVNVGGISQGNTPNFQSPSSIYGYAANAGFSGSDLVTAVAIALAESGGNANAYNPELAAQALNGAPDGQGSAGLWQIYQFAHPEFEGEDLYDPQTNANAAFSVYSDAGNSFSPWTTFKSAAYLAHIGAAQSVTDGGNTSGDSSNSDDLGADYPQGA